MQEAQQQLYDAAETLQQQEAQLEEAAAADAANAAAKDAEIATLAAQLQVGWGASAYAWLGAV